MSYISGLLGSALILIGGYAFAADPPGNPPGTIPNLSPTVPATQVPRAAEPETSATVTMTKSVPMRKIVGLNVRNSQGEKLGSIGDLVVNLENGQIVYAALSVGGVLGIGDKLFAVPYQELTFNHGKDGLEVVINISKDRLQAAPGFSKDQWPDFADPEWRNQVDNYYRQSQANDSNRSTTH